MDKNILDVIKQAKTDGKITAVALFGSSLKGKGRDIDICIFMDKKYSNLEMSKKQLDFMKNAKSNLDIQIFQLLPIYIRMRILKEGKILLDKNSEFLYNLAFDTIKEFEFFRKSYEIYLEEVKNGSRKKY